MKLLAIATALTVASAGVFAAGPDAAALAQAKNCMTCHAMDAKVIGPGYKEVAAKYKGNKKAIMMLEKKVIAGGSGVWGSVPMPPNPITPAEAKTLVAWIMSQK